MKTYAIIPAGGKGTRSGFSAPKQYLKFFGKELLAYTMEIFQENKLVDEIIVAADPAYFNLVSRLKKKYKFSKITGVVKSGKKRQDSVYNALRSIKPGADDLVIVHDAARPLLPQGVLTNAVQSAEKKGNALVCIKAKDTLVKGDQKVKSYLDRDLIYNVQTPQIFTYQILKKAMDKAKKEKFYGTDESMLVSKYGEKINIVEGSFLNFKVTDKTDVEMFRKLISQSKKNN